MLALRACALAIGLTATLGCPRAAGGGSEPATSPAAEPDDAPDHDVALPDPAAGSDQETEAPTPADADAAMWAVLRGVSDDLDAAEAAQEQVFAATTGAQRSRRAIALARFYNLRALRGDASKAERQAQIYAEILDDRATPSMDAETFRAWCFSQLGALLAQRAEGRMMAAMATVKRVETALAQRVADQPDDVEAHALAGNFAAFFAGNVPFDKRTRTARAERHLAVVHERWDEMRLSGRDPDHCPNSRLTYAFALAEARLALGDTAGATAIYTGLDESGSDTPVRRQFLRIAADRKARRGELSGDLGLMPPWPSDVENCVVCHGTRALSEASLYAPPARDKTN